MLSLSHLLIDAYSPGWTEKYWLEGSKCQLERARVPSARLVVESHVALMFLLRDAAMVETGSKEEKEERIGRTLA